MLTVGKILVTLAVLGFSVIPALADLNATHATNPTWTRHARFHVVWQSSSYNLLAILALALVWWPGDHDQARTLLAGTIAACGYLGFFSALVTRKAYDGRLYDDNGYPPFHLNIVGKRRAFDVNNVVFSFMFALTLVAVAVTAAS